MIVKDASEKVCFIFVWTSKFNVTKISSFYSRSFCFFYLLLFSPNVHIKPLWHKQNLLQLLSVHHPQNVNAFYGILLDYFVYFFRETNQPVGDLFLPIAIYSQWDLSQPPQSPHTFVQPVCQKGFLWIQSNLTSGNIGVGFFFFFITCLFVTSTSVTGLKV